MLKILLTNTKVPRSTKVLVAGVKEKILKVPLCGDGAVCSAGWGENPHELRSPCVALQGSRGDPSCGHCIPV